MNSVLVLEQDRGQLVLTPAEEASVLVTNQPIAQLVIEDPSTGTQTLVVQDQAATLSLFPAAPVSTLVATQTAAALYVGVEAIEILEALGNSGPAIPPDINSGAHGKITFAKNLDATGATEEGSIRITGKRINCSGDLGRVNVTQKAVETALHTGGLTGIYWLVIGAENASTRFPGWASATDGPFFLASFNPLDGTFAAIDSAVQVYSFVPDDNDCVCLRVVRKSGTSAGIEKLHSYVVNSAGLAPDFEVALTAPADDEITVEGVVSLAKDGTARPRLSVSSSVAQPGQDIYVRWRAAAGAYAGCDVAYDFLSGLYQLDAGAVDPEATWVDAPHKIKGEQPQGLFGGFDGGELLDVETQWRGPDGLISDWQLTTAVSIPGKTAAATAVTNVVSLAKANGNLTDWDRSPDSDAKEFWVYRTTSGTVTPGARPDWAGHATHWDDRKAPSGTWTYVVFALNRSQTAPDWSAGTAGNAVTTRGTTGSDIDATAPATIGAAPSLSQRIIFDADGSPRLRLQASLATPSDAAQILWAIQRDGQGFEPETSGITATTTTRTWVVDVGEVCQVKCKSVNAVGVLSAAYSSTATKTIAGDAVAPGVPVVTSATVAAKQDGSLLAKGWAWPGDADLYGGLLWVGTSSSSASATTFAGFVNPHQLHARIEAPFVTVGTPAYVFLQTLDTSANLAAKTLLGHDTPRLGRQTDLEDGTLDLGGSKITGNLPAGQGLTLSSGNSINAAPTTLRAHCSDGDVVTFPFDLGVAPDLDFLTGSLPAPASGNTYVATANSLTSTGFTASIKQVTPGTTVAQNTGAGAADATIPSPGQPANGFSVAKGVTPDAYNSIYQAKLNLTFTTANSSKLGAAVFRVYRFDGATWTKITDVMFVAGATSGFTGVCVGGWSTTLSMASTDLWGFQLLSFNPGTTGCTINSLNAVTFKTQSASGVTSATPNGEDVTVLIWPKNQS